MPENLQYLVGVDEAGRGPLAGPVAVGIVCLPAIALAEAGLGAGEEILAIFGEKGVRDSKKLSEKKREEIFDRIQELKKEEKLDFVVTLVSNKVIDEKGISVAIKSGISECLKKLNLKPESCLIKLDGGLKASGNYLNQETIIRGDEQEPVIALASICAKVVRDKWMGELARKYPNYALEKHKGYGTKSHYEALKKSGISPIHRKSFLKNFITHPTLSYLKRGRNTKK
ncbi:MAG: ribonuclease HII [Patescibacteria group bacterium]